MYKYIYILIYIRTEAGGKNLSDESYARIKEAKESGLNNPERSALVAELSVNLTRGISFSDGDIDDPVKIAPSMNLTVRTKFSNESPLLNIIQSSMPH